MKVLIGLLAAFSLVFASSASAQAAYPDKPIKILVGFSPGVAPDVTSRLFADKFSETWARGVVVENVTGAGGNLAVERTAKAPADGYNLVMGGNAAVVINPNLIDKLGYDPVKDFTYITQVFIVPNIMVVTPDVPARTVQEVIALARQKPDYFVAGHAGVGTSQHLAGELFMKMTGVKIQQVPYRGTTAILPDLLGGRLNIFFIKDAGIKVPQ
ncbi:MAG: hypothetical protein K2Z80_18550 [Xanthobacteraceae bacterium]|nr:hypothetical protein [Xanthobacteraceae bacterium]